MTEQEAIEELKYQEDMRAKGMDYQVNNLVIGNAISALEEIQQYRVLGTVEEIRSAMKYLRLAKKHGTVGQVIEKCAEYESIGAPEELREAREKQVPKKLKIGNDNGNPRKCCARCGCFVLPTSRYCSKCGQAIDWEE